MHDAEVRYYVCIRQSNYLVEVSTYMMGGIQKYFGSGY